MRIKWLVILPILFVAFAGFGKDVIAAPNLNLTPSSGNQTVNTNFSVTIGVDSETESSSAVDVWGTYDAAKLEVVSITKASSPVFPYDLTPVYDNTAGTFNFSAASNDLSNLSTQPIDGDLAVITFKPKSVGTAGVNFTCTAGSTTDSNIFNVSVTDVIGCSSNISGSFTISAASATGSATTTSTTITPTVTTTLPETGGVIPTAGLIVFGIVSVLGALFLKFL